MLGMLVIGTFNALTIHYILNKKLGIQIFTANKTELAIHRS